MADAKPTKLTQVKNEAGDAAWLVAAGTSTKVFQKHFIALLQKELAENDPKLRNKIAKFMKGDIGNLICASALSLGLEVAGPILAQTFSIKPERLERLASALRTEGFRQGGSILAEKLVGPLTDATAEMLRGVPEVEVSSVRELRPGERLESVPSTPVKAKAEV